MFLKILLYPLSILYKAACLCDRFFTKQEKLFAPVISVGNITWGGTGKTPIVIELLSFLASRDIKAAVLTRGYARKSKNTLLLKNGAKNIAPFESGDEPLLIAKSAPFADVIVGADRYSNALKYKDEIKAGVFVLDDGFQHWKIKRDLDIVCINAANPFGNGMLIPSGILRENLSALKRAGLIIITNADMVPRCDLENLKEKIYLSSGIEPLITHYGNYLYKQIDLINDFDSNKIKSGDVYILCGIGFAEGFRNSVEKSGVKVKGEFVLNDHEKYDKQKLYKILDKTKGGYLITTAKDAVKIDFYADEEIKKRTAVLTVKPVFETGKKQWEEMILKSLRSF